MTCKAKQYSDHLGPDQMKCDACGLSWDVGDTDPPKCRQAVACAVCEGEAGAVKIGRFDLCLDPRCAEIAKVWITRQPDGSTYWEAEAIKTGGKAGGAYLQTLGVYDLSKLTPDQYGTFSKTLVQSYRAELRRQGALRAPPF